MNENIVDVLVVEPQTKLTPPIELDLPLIGVSQPIPGKSDFSQVVDPQPNSIFFLPIDDLGLPIKELQLSDKEDESNVQINDDLAFADTFLAMPGPVPTEVVHSYKDFFIDDNIAILLIHIVAICSNNPSKVYKAKHVNPKLKSICGDRVSVDDNPSGVASKQWLGKKTGYLDKLAKYFEESGIELLPILNHVKIGEGSHGRVRWSTTFPSYLAPRLFSQTREFKTLAELALALIPEWSEDKSYGKGDYYDFMNDFVNHFCTNLKDGTRVHIILKTSLLNVLVKYLREKGIVKEDFAWRGDVTKTLRRCTRDGKLLFKELNNKDKGEIWWAVNPEVIPLNQQRFTYIPSSHFRAMFADTLPESIFSLLETPVPFEVRGSMAFPNSAVEQQQMINLPDPKADSEPDYDLCEMVFSDIDLSFTNNLMDPDVVNKDFTKQPHQLVEPLPVQQPIESITPPEVLFINPNHPMAVGHAIEIRAMRAEQADPWHVAAYYESNPDKIPKEFLNENIASIKNDYQRSCAIARARNAAVLAAFSLNKIAKQAAQPTENDSSDDDFEVYRERYDTRLSTKKRTFNEGEDSPSKKNKSSSESDAENDILYSDLI